MTIAIGRAGRDSNLTLNSPTYWSVNGDDVEAAGALTASTYAKLVLLRAQVNGLADNRDEPVVAVNWAGDVSVDGFYEVIDASVPMPARGIAALKLDWRVKLRRVGVYPDINSVLMGNKERTNSHSIVKGSTVPWWAVPDDAVMDYVPSVSTATRVTDSGTVKVWYTTNGTVLYNTLRRWACNASDYYDGAARVEVYDGTNWYALVGLRLPNTSPTVGWRITNGLTRVSYGGGDGLLKVESYVSGAWSVSKTYKLTVGTGPTTLGAFRTITITRNSPEAVSVRVGLDQDNTSIPAACTLDLTLRRGALWVDCALERAADVGTALSDELGLYRNTAEAATAHTGGVHATSADAQGGKYVLNTALGKTNDLTQGGFRTTSTIGPFNFQIGYEPPSAATIDDFTRQTYAWFAALDETVGVARR